MNGDLGTLIPVNVNTPTWQQVGTVFNSQHTGTVTVAFISMGPAATGNDYSIDDISLQEVDVNPYTPIKTVDKSSVTLGDTVNFTVTLSSTGNNPLTNITFQDTLASELTFVPGSVIINGISFPNVDPNIGFPVIPDIQPGGTATISFAATATSAPQSNPIINSAEMSYYYSPVDGGIQNQYTVTSNDVEVEIIYADLSVTKTVDHSTIQPRQTLTYTITVTNNGAYLAQQYL